MTKFCQCHTVLRLLIDLSNKIQFFKTYKINKKHTYVKAWIKSNVAHFI